MTLRLLLLFALEQGCLSLQVYGDSLLVIEWAKELIQCHVVLLLPILEEVFLLKQQFNYLSFTHVFRARNGVADQLSKEALQRPIDFGIWKITEHSRVGSSSYYHRPYFDPVM